MSEPSDSKRVRIGLVPVLVAIVLLVCVALWFALAQSGGSGAPPPVGQPTTGEQNTSYPSGSPTPSASATERPLPTADEWFTENFGAGYELRDDSGNPAGLCEANRWFAPYNPEIGTPSGRSFVAATKEALLEVAPVGNDEVNGYFGIIFADC